MIGFIGFLLVVSFVGLVHLTLRPLIESLYLKWEPLFWHWEFKRKKKVEKVKGKLRKKYMFLKELLRYTMTRRM